MTSERAANVKPTWTSGPDGAALALHDFGGAGRRLLFSHATGLHGLVFAPVIDNLIGEFHCTSFDLRGHGDSPLPDDCDLHWSGFGRDVAAVAAALGSEPVIGIGHSLGATALLFAEAESPGLFEQLILYEPALATIDDSLLGDDLQMMQRAVVSAAMRRRPAFASRAMAYETYAAKRPWSDVDPEALRDYVAHGFADAPDGGVFLKCTPSVEASIYMQSYEFDVSVLVDSIRCPITVVLGGVTDDIQIRSSTVLSRRLDMPLVRLETLGHFGPLQQPAAFAATIKHVLGTELEGSSLGIPSWNRDIVAPQ